jgi:tetratricopeptide (TPR) repeat protein
MLAGLIALILTDAMLFIVVRLVGTWAKERGKPLSLLSCFLLLLFCCVGHYAATAAMGRVAVTYEERWLALAASALFGLAPIGAYVHMVFSHPDVGGLNQRPGYAERARILRLAGNIDAAFREYCAAFDAEQGNADPLFAAANMLRQAERYDTAARVLRKVMDRFETDSGAYQRAKTRLDALLKEEAARENEPAGLVVAESVDAQVVELEKLAVLLAKGVLTEEEFAAKKKQLLGL